MVTRATRWLECLEAFVRTTAIAAGGRPVAERQANGVAHFTELGVSVPAAGCHQCKEDDARELFHVRSLGIPDGRRLG